MVTKGGNRDVVIGAVVVAVAALALVLAYGMDGRANAKPGYEVQARFNRLDGIGVGSAVRVSGVHVGEVAGQSLDANFRAVTRLRLDPLVQLPVDSSAAIRTDGLLGAKYIELSPGGDERNLKDGESISYTQDAMVIEDLLEMIIEQGKAKRGFAGRALPSMTN